MGAREDLARKQAQAASSKARPAAAAQAMNPADLAKRQAAAATGKTVDSPFEESGSGIFHEAGNILNMARALPAGLVGMVGDAGDSVWNAARIFPTALAAGAGAMQGKTREEIAKDAEDSPLGLAQALVSPDMLRGVQPDPDAQEGVGQYLPFSGEFSATAHELFPFFGAAGTSANATIRRGVDAASATNLPGIIKDVAEGKNPGEDLADTEYAQLWQKGELAPAVLEDLANLSMVAEVGGAGAGRLAGRAGRRAGDLEAQVARQAEPGPIAVGPSGPEAPRPLRPGPDGIEIPTAQPYSAEATLPAAPVTDQALVAKAARARSQADAFGTLEQGLQKTARMTGRAGDLPATMWKAPGLLGETMGGRFGLFSRTATPAGRAGLASRVLPFGTEGTRTGLVGFMRDRGMDSLVENLDRTPRGAAAVNWVQDHPVAAVQNFKTRMAVQGDVRAIEDEATDVRGRIAQGGLKADKANRQAARILRADIADVERVPTMIAAALPESMEMVFDDPQHMAQIAEAMAADGMIPEADVNMARDLMIASEVGAENVTAFKIADQYRRGTMNPEAARRLEMANENLREAARAPRQARFMADEGEVWEPTDARRRTALEQRQPKPMESVVQSTIVPARQRLEQRQAATEAQEKRVAAAEARQLVTDAEYRRPTAPDIVDTRAERGFGQVSADTLGPVERVAGVQGAADFAQDRARGLFARPLDETATPGEFAAGVRQGVRVEDRARKVGRDAQAAQDRAETVLDRAGAGAVRAAPTGGLFQEGNVADTVDLPHRPTDRAEAVVSEVAGPPVPAKKTPRIRRGKERIDEVRAAVLERFDREVADLAEESTSKFGSESLPELPWIPPLRADGGFTVGSTPEWWHNSLSPAERRDFAKAYMQPEPPKDRLRRMGVNEANRRAGKGNFYEDGDVLHDELMRHDIDRRRKRPQDEIDAIVGAVGGVEAARNNLPPYKHAETYLALENRYVNRSGAADDINAGYELADQTDANWFEDYARIADRQTQIARVRKILEGKDRGAQMDQALELRDNVNPEMHVITDVVDGIEVDVVSRAEAEAALSGGYYAENGDWTPYTATQRRELMADALDQRRTEIRQQLEEKYQRNVETAMTADFTATPLDALPWEVPAAQFIEEVQILTDSLDAIEAQVGRVDPDADGRIPGEVDPWLYESYAALMPEGFGGTPAEVHATFLKHADDRGLSRVPDEETGPAFDTPDQIADRAVADVLEKVTDAFETDAGARAAGWESLTARERAVYRQFEAAAKDIDAKKLVAAQRLEVSELRDRMRAGIEETTLDREMMALARSSERLGQRAAGQRQAARYRSIRDLARQVTKDQRKVGERQGIVNYERSQYRKALRLEDKAARKLAAAEVEARLSPEATPAMYAEGTRARSKASNELRALAERTNSPYLLQLADDIGRIDAYSVAEAMGLPEQIISGDPTPGTGQPKGVLSDLPIISNPGTRRQKSRTGDRGQQTDYSTRGQTVLEARRAVKQVTNIGAREMLNRWGETPAQAMAKRPARVRPGEEPPVDLTELSGAELARAMDAEGYTTWDPANFTGSIPPGQVTQETRFVPKIVKTSTTKMLNEQSSFSKAIEKWYDRRFMGQIKMFWLALSPRWLTANVVGNALMGMIGGGVAPHTYMQQLSNARALLAEDAPVDWEDGNRFQRRRFRKRGELVARGDRLRAEGMTSPHRALNRGFTSEEVPYLRPENGAEIRNPIRKLAASSYQANEYVDNVGRTAIYLAKMEPRRQLWERWDNGEISTDEFKAQIRNTRGPEAALKQALRAAGDFSKLSAFEKQAVKRIWVFYPWYRHITKLAMSMPIYSPARTVWMLHLADVFGGDDDDTRRAGAGSDHQASLPSFAQGGVPMFGDTELSSAGLNPFSAGLSSPFYSAEGALGAVTPALQWPAALLLGKDMKHGMRDFTRSPGSGNLDEYGRPVGTPLAERPSEAWNYMIEQFPQGRLLQTAKGDTENLTYDTGELMLVGGNPVESGRPTGLTGLGMGLLGIPTPTNVDAEGIAERTAKKQRDQAKKAARYRQQLERVTGGG